MHALLPLLHKNVNGCERASERASECMHLFVGFLFGSQEAKKVVGKFMVQMPIAEAALSFHYVQSGRDAPVHRHSCHTYI